MRPIEYMTTRTRRVPQAAAPVLSIVVPCYNEEPVLSETWARLGAVRQALVSSGKISPASEVIFVDDGSRDQTWFLIQSISATGAPVRGVRLSRNCGHQNALLAGLSEARGDAVVTIDADLQDDEGAIESMVDAFREGCEVVYGVRRRRDSDSWFKRSTARGFYSLMARLGVQTIRDHADYRLLSRRAIAWLQQFDEANLFLRGIVPMIGLRSTIVLYDRRCRVAGESKYPLRKMIEFALNGITSFSIAPLRAITGLGVMLSSACLALACWVLWIALMSSHAVPGWASTVLPILFFSGVQLFCTGVLGEYVGKIYLETKKRPRFLVEQVIEPASVVAKSLRSATELPEAVLRSDRRVPAAPAAEARRGRHLAASLTPNRMPGASMAR